MNFEYYLSNAEVEECLVSAERFGESRALFKAGELKDDVHSSQSKL
jgi:hypothetical protein